MAELSAFYKRPGARYTRINGLTEKMFGKESAPDCKTKAKETEGLVYFCVHLLASLKDRLIVGKQLLEAGQALLRVVESLRDSPDTPSAAYIQDQLNYYCQHCKLLDECGGKRKPKHHAVVHLLARQMLSGAARYGATWLDESHNHRAKQIAAACHGLTWYASFYQPP